MAYPFKKSRKAKLIPCALCNCFIREFNDFLLCFVTPSCRMVNASRVAICCRSKTTFTSLDVKCRLFRFFFLSASAWNMLSSKFYFCGWSHVVRSWRWPAQAYILGFHMTSPKLKLRNYLFFWISEFHEVYTAPKHLHLNKVLVRKGSLR